MKRLSENFLPTRFWTEVAVCPHLPYSPDLAPRDNQKMLSSESRTEAPSSSPDDSQLTYIHDYCNSYFQLNVYFSGLKTVVYWYFFSLTFRLRLWPASSEDLAPGLLLQY